MSSASRSLLGTVSEVQQFDVERGHIRGFAEAIGDPNPVFERGDIAPPTFATTFRVHVPGMEDLEEVTFGEGEVYCA